MKIAFILFGITLFSEVVLSQENAIKPGSIFREYTCKKVLSPFKGEFTYNDTFYVDLNIKDLDKAIGAEIALKFWGGHSGTSNQTFKINGSEKFNFPHPKTPENPYCYYRTILGNPPVEIPVKLLKQGDNRFTFFCGPQICYNYNWPHYWLYSFTARIFYHETKNCVKGNILKGLPKDTAYNLIGLRASVSDSSRVKSVEYIGFYQDYDLDGDGKSLGWHYSLNNGNWESFIDKKYTPPYNIGWNNFWIPEQNGTIKIVAKINDYNGLSYITTPVEYKALKQKGTTVKMYNTQLLHENFGARVGERKQCNIPIQDDLSKAVGAYLILSTWSGAPEDGAIHQLGINGKVLADSPGVLHDYAFLKIPVPIEYLKRGDNTFFIYSETEGHAFEINYPGPSILIRYKK